MVACSRAAHRRGVMPGMLLAEAQSLWPASVGAAARFEEHDPLADRQALRALAHWGQQFSPVVALDEAPAPDCLLMDVTGCGFGFNGEEGLAEKVVASFQRRGYGAVVASADTVGAAWAVAHHGAQKFEIRNSNFGFIVPPGRHGEVLRPLPVEALRLPAEAVQTLHELNIFRVEQLLALPRASLPSRFGAEILRCIDRALGVLPEVLTPERSVEPLEAAWHFEPPVADGRILTAVIEQLLERLLTKLLPGHGVQQLLCALKLAGHDPILFPVELLRASAAQRDLMELVRLQVERLRIPAEVSVVTVRAPVVAPLEFQQEEMFGGTGELNQRHEVAGLLERLSSRLGERAVLRPRLWPDAQPELAHQYEPWVSHSIGSAAHSRPPVFLPPPLGGRAGVGGTRLAGSAPLPPHPNPALQGGREQAPFPSREGQAAFHSSLLRGWMGEGLLGLHRPTSLKSRPLTITVVSIFPGGPPERFHWDGCGYIVARSWGPERIETGWWRGADVRRDYYVVETVTGERFWVFRDLAGGSWFLHGVFA